MFYSSRPDPSSGLATRSLIFIAYRDDIQDHPSGGSLERAAKASVDHILKPFSVGHCAFYKLVNPITIPLIP
jgi:hypothetical protein